jgi:eukaryotic-like serine/threonine-protein kinase
MVDRTTAAASKEAAPDPLIGRVINEKFKILGFIARGGMGKVYRAEQTPLGRVCAVKVLHPSYTGDHDPEFHKRFFLEASMTSKLRHPNTVTIFDYGHTDDGIYYMAMEYLEGYTLHRAIRQVGHLPEERTAHIARQICRSLREAHSLGVVHRDLKPANVYLLEHGDEPDFVKVLDFGLVKDVSSGSEELTKAGLFMGSPKYMAPEQITGAPIDGRTDIYALGVIMYEMVTGKVPFDRPKSLEILMAHAGEVVPPIRKMNPAARVSPALEEAIMRSVAKNPNDRYRSMDEVLAALKRLGPATGAEPSASMTADRLSLGSGPTASRIVLGAGAAMSVPSPERAGGAGAPVSERPPSPVHAAAMASDVPEGRPYGLVAAVVVAIGVAAGVAYEKLHLPFAGGDASTTAAPAAPAAPIQTVAAAPSPSAVSSGSVPSAASTAVEPQKPAPQIDLPVLPPATATSARPGPGAPAPAPYVGGLPAIKPRPASSRAPAGPAPSAAKPAVDCNPSYYYDVDGNKHFKPECFGR